MRTIYGKDLHQATVFHAVEITPDPDMFGGDFRWHYTGLWSNAIIVANRESLITAIADLIGAGELNRLEIYEPGAGPQLPHLIDRAGNIWLDSEPGPGRDYLAPADYLPRLIR